MTSASPNVDSYESSFASDLKWRSLGKPNYIPSVRSKDVYRAVAVHVLDHQTFVEKAYVHPARIARSTHKGDYTFKGPASYILVNFHCIQSTCHNIKLSING
mmetsp:Transcript_22412/g.40721  ORF Transcript_22412/g.40721 Transcript_22412/m.40721 type:complete len:102 (+) Transcript_22412:1239-1544(+)